MSRLIDDILVFRSDISPFLVHLTRDVDNNDSQRKAEDNLVNILQNRKLIPGDFLLDARNGWSKYWELAEQEQLELFNAICFTETPLNEIHCLLEIIGRQMNLKPFGIVFLKDKLKHKNVSPVFYVNNWQGNNSDIFYELCKISDTNIAKKILPLVSVFGKKVIQPGYRQPKDDKDVDFYWEREWRRPRIFGDFDFLEEDVFIGLCPHEKIGIFESRFSWLKFVDPMKNMKWYADKLIDAKRRCGLKYSVI
jgi:hypothetical protein